MKYYKNQNGVVFSIEEGASLQESDELTVEITEEEYNDIRNKKYYFTDGEGNFFICNYRTKFHHDECWTTELTEEEYAAMHKPKFQIYPEKQAIYNQLALIKKWFADTDYYVNKIITGEWSTDDIRWQNYLKERKVKRDLQDSLTAQLYKL